MAELQNLLEPFAYGRGFQEIVAGTSPDAGANFIYKIDSRWETRLIAILFRLVTSADVADRFASVDFTDQDGNVYDRCGAAVVAAASTTADYVGQLDRGVAEWASGTPIFFPLNDVFLEGGHSLRVNVANIDNTDQLSAIRMVLERFPTGKRGYPEGEIHRAARRRR